MALNKWIYHVEKRSSEENIFSSQILNNDKGIALVMTMFIVMILAVIVLDGFSASYVDISIAGNFRDSVKSEYIARAGIRGGMAILQRDKDKSVDTLSEDWSMLKNNIFPFPVGDGGVHLEIYDEGSKINLNNLVKDVSPKDDSPETHDRVWIEIFERLFKSLDIDPDLVYGIVDWIDEDNQPENRGAENDFYESQERPYNAKNRWMKSLRELLLIKGITPEIYKKIEPFVTVSSGTFSYTPSSNSSDGKININTASATVLSALSVQITEHIAEEIVKYREVAPFRDSINDLKRVQGIGLTNPISDISSVRSDHFTIIAEGSVNEVTRKERAILKRSSSGDITLIECWSE